MRWNRCMTYAAITAAFLLLTPALNPVARADSPNSITATVNGQDVADASLQFGRSHALVARTENGAPVTFAASGGCMLQTTASGTESRGVLRVSFAGVPCEIVMTAPATDDFSVGSATFTLPTVRGVQRARIAASSGSVSPGSVTRLGTRQIGTDQGLKVSWRVAKGRSRCSLGSTTSSRVVRAGSRPGRCTVVARAPGVPGQYQPFLQTLRFTVR